MTEIVKVQSFSPSTGPESGPLEYSSHLRKGASKHSLATLDTLDKRTIRLIDNPTLPIEEAFPHFPCFIITMFYHGMCCNKLNSLIPPQRSRRFADSQHPFAVKLGKFRTTSSANTFIPMTSRT